MTDEERAEYIAQREERERRNVLGRRHDAAMGDADDQGTWSWLRDNAANVLTPEQSYESLTDNLLGESAVAGIGQRQDDNAALDMLIEQTRADATGQVDSGGMARRSLADAEHAQGMRQFNDRAARDTSGSGASFQDQMDGLGDLNNGMLNNYTSIVGNEQSAALDSLMTAGRASGQARGQRFQENFVRGQAVDQFNMANLGQQRDVSGRNTEREYQQGRDEAGSELQAFQNRTAYERSRNPVDEYTTQRADEAAHKEQDDKFAPYFAVMDTANNIIG